MNRESILIMHERANKNAIYFHFFYLPYLYGHIKLLKQKKIYIIKIWSLSSKLILFKLMMTQHGELL